MHIKPIKVGFIALKPEDEKILNKNISNNPMKLNYSNKFKHINKKLAIELIINVKGSTQSDLEKNHLGMCGKDLHEYQI